MLLQPGCTVLLHLQRVYRGCWVYMRRTFQKRMSLITPHYYTSIFFSKKAVMLGKLSESSGMPAAAQDSREPGSRGHQSDRQQHTLDGNYTSPGGQNGFCGTEQHRELCHSPWDTTRSNEKGLSSASAGSRCTAEDVACRGWWPQQPSPAAVEAGD